TLRRMTVGDVAGIPMASAFAERKSHHLASQIALMKKTIIFSKSIRSIRPAFVLLAGILTAAPAMAQSVLNVKTGHWNTAGRWGVSVVPVSSNTTHLVFNSTGTPNYTATNNIGVFQPNKLTINHAGTGVITIGGSTANTLPFAGTTPTIDVTGTAVLTGLLT